MPSSDAETLALLGILIPSGIVLLTGYAIGALWLDGSFKTNQIEVVSLGGAGAKGAINKPRVVFVERKGTRRSRRHRKSN